MSTYKAEERDTVRWTRNNCNCLVTYVNASVCQIMVSGAQIQVPWDEVELVESYAEQQWIRQEQYAEERKARRVEQERNEASRRLRYSTAAYMPQKPIISEHLGMPQPIPVAVPTPQTAHECPPHPTIADTLHHNQIVESEIDVLLSSIQKEKRTK